MTIDEKKTILCENMDRIMDTTREFEGSWLDEEFDKDDSDDIQEMRLEVEALLNKMYVKLDKMYCSLDEWEKEEEEEEEEEELWIKKL